MSTATFLPTMPVRSTDWTIFFSDRFPREPLSPEQIVDVCERREGVVLTESVLSHPRAPDIAGALKKNPTVRLQLHAKTKLSPQQESVRHAFVTAGAGIDWVFDQPPEKSILNLAASERSRFFYLENWHFPWDVHRGRMPFAPSALLRLEKRSAADPFLSDRQWSRRIPCDTPIVEARWLAPDGEFLERETRPLSFDTIPLWGDAASILDRASPVLGKLLLETLRPSLWGELRGRIGGRR